jgi:hypothetical protein
MAFEGRANCLRERPVLAGRDTSLSDYADHLGFALRRADSDRCHRACAHTVNACDYLFQQRRDQVVPAFDDYLFLATSDEK